MLLVTNQRNNGYKYNKNKKSGFFSIAKLVYFNAALKFIEHIDLFNAMRSNTTFSNFFTAFQCMLCALLSLHSNQTMTYLGTKKRRPSRIQKKERSVYGEVLKRYKT